MAMKVKYEDHLKQKVMAITTGTPCSWSRYRQELPVGKVCGFQGHRA